jgi:GntR family transcriptional regulator/MocR family aminotransferase
VVFPSLGIGYAIVPVGMIDGFRRALALVGRPASKLDQLVLTDFINEGHFARHLRRMRTIHEERRTALIGSVKEHLDHILQVIGADAGLHCTARLDPRFCDKQIARRALEMGVIIKPLSDYFVSAKSGKKLGWNGLIFGFATAPPAEIRAAIKKISHLFT